MATRAWTAFTYSEGIRRRDLQFDQMPVLRHSSDGFPYSSGVDVGMPAISAAILDSVVYLYPDEESAREGKEFGGSGFIVGVRSAAQYHLHYLYVVTNYHVAVKPREGKQSPVIRVNKIEGLPDIFPFTEDQWEFSPGNGDLAAIPLPGDTTIHKLDEYIGLDAAISAHQVQYGNLGSIGEDSFMVGRFISHDGGQTNIPSVRFGHISMALSHIPDMPNGSPDTQYFCLEMQSRSGFSGSPVFSYRTPGSDLLSPRASDGTMPNIPTRWGLLGIHCGQFPEEMKTTDGRGVVGYSGMCCVLPAWKIAELLHCKKFTDARAEMDAKWKIENSPIEESK